MTADPSLLRLPINDALTHEIIGAAIEVHRTLGPGLLESAYEECLCYELTSRGVRFERQIPLPLSYKALEIHHAYKLDLLIDNAVIVEIKAIERLLPVHEAQVLTYLKLSGRDTGLLINFNAVPLKAGIRRLRKGISSPVSPVSLFPSPQGATES